MRLYPALPLELDLDALGCYKSPSIRVTGAITSGSGQGCQEPYVNMTVTYTFGSKTEVLDGDEIHEWLVSDEGTGSIDPDSGRSLIKSLASTYNTGIQEALFCHQLRSECGGIRFLRLEDQSVRRRQERASMGIWRQESIVSREPVYLQTAASHGKADYGSTYAEEGVNRRPST